MEAGGESGAIGVGTAVAVGGGNMSDVVAKTEADFGDIAAGQLAHQRCVTVVGGVCRDDAAFACHAFGHAHGYVIGLRACAGEQEGRQALGHFGGEALGVVEDTVV